jgi:RimJ/RimL family protein N-acetyltransferase
MSLREIIDALAREPLRHVVLLKQLLAYPDHVEVFRVSGAEGVATLVMLDVSASAYDREAYPKAALAAFVESDHPRLTAALTAHLPRDVGIVFKLSRDDDLAPVAAQFPVERRTAFVSFTSADAFEPVAGVHVTSSPSDAAFRLFATQGHDRTWLEPLLQAGQAFACVLERNGEPLSACFAFENHGPVWEIGGVVTPPAHRKQGYGARVVRAALAELGRRRLMPRYQVEEGNIASIALARSIGLAPFVTITHYVTTGPAGTR